MMKVDICLLKTSSPTGKIEEKHKLAFSGLPLVLFSMKILCIEIYGECYRKCIGGYHC